MSNGPTAIFGMSYRWVRHAIIESADTCRTCANGATYALALYPLLTELAFSSAHHECYPRRQWLAEQIGCSESTINRALKVLETVGAANVTTAYGPVTTRNAKYEFSAERSIVNSRGQGQVARHSVYEVAFESPLDRRPHAGHGTSALRNGQQAGGTPAKSLQRV